MKSSATGVAQNFTATDAAEFSGLSLAMVNYLCRHGIVTPTNGGKRGRGIQRNFSFGDIVVLKAIAKLLVGGVSVYRLRRALRTLRSVHPEITRKGLPASYLVTDGRDVLLRHSTGVLELLRNGQFSFAFVVEMDSVRRDAAAFAQGKKFATVNKQSKGFALPKRTRTGS